MLISGFNTQPKMLKPRFGNQQPTTPPTTPSDSQAGAAKPPVNTAPAAPVNITPAAPAAPTTPVMDVKQVRPDRDVIDVIKLVLKLNLPAIKETWPLALMLELIREDSVEKYVSQTANITRAALSEGIDTQALPKRSTLKEGTLSGNYYLETISPQMREFAAQEGKELITPVMLWRWLMKTDPNGKLDKLLKDCGFDEVNIRKLREAPSLEKPATIINKRQLTKEDILAFRNAMAELPKRVIGQEGPVQELIDGMRVARTGYTLSGEEELPKTRFLLLGPSGVGKTYACEELAKIMKRPVIYVTMTEYMNEMDAKKFTGAAPGYTGYGDPTFVDKVRKAVDEAEKNGQPRLERLPNGAMISVPKDETAQPPIIILDEIEKAHPIVIKTILQMLGKGRLEDSQQNVAIFKDCDILMTSNVAQKEIARAQELGASEEDLAEIVDIALKQAFPYEFLGRINKKIIFQSLSRDDAGKILDMQIKKLAKAAKEADNYTLETTPETKSNILDNFYSLDTGARRLKDGVQTLVHEPLLVKKEDIILADGVLDGGKMVVDFKDKKPVLTFEPAKQTASPTTAA